MDDLRETRQGAASPQRLTLHSALDPNLEIDVTTAVKSAVAHEIWIHTGANAVLNWIEAEAFVDDLLRRLARPAPEQQIEPLPFRPAAPTSPRRVVALSQLPRPARAVPTIRQSPPSRAHDRVPVGR
jgi:hypothetical protein